MYQLKEPFWQFVDHWQTLIAGGLALLAGIVTVWGTLRAANRQVKAANDAADREIKAAKEAAGRQIAAAQEQTKAAQHQTEVMRDMERRRVSREGYAFYAMLVAAMEAVINDVEAARVMPAQSPKPSAFRDIRDSPEAYTVRQRVNRAGFAELRTAFVRFGGPTLSDKFLQLEKEIEDFAAQHRTEYHQSGAPMHLIGRIAGISEQLDRIEQQATELRFEAERGMEITRGVLGNDLA